MISSRVKNLKNNTPAWIMHLKLTIFLTTLVYKFLFFIFKMLHTEEELENILNNFKERILVKNCLECVEKKSFYTDGRVVCCNKIKKHRYSIYKNTCFYHRKVSIITILKIINLFLNNMPYKLIAYIGGLSRNRVTDIIYMFNYSSIPDYYLNIFKIGRNIQYN